MILQLQRPFPRPRFVLRSFIEAGCSLFADVKQRSLFRGKLADILVLQNTCLVEPSLAVATSGPSAFAFLSNWEQVSRLFAALRVREERDDADLLLTNRADCCRRRVGRRLVRVSTLIVEGNGRRGKDFFTA